MVPAVEAPQLRLPVNSTNREATWNHLGDILGPLGDILAGFTEAFKFVCKDLPKFLKGSLKA